MGVATSDGNFVISEITTRFYNVRQFLRNYLIGKVNTAKLQEIALYGEFSIRETLKYFGWVSDMTTVQVEARLDFLVNLLMLPDPDR